MRDKADMMSSQARTANLTNLFDSVGDIGRESYARNMIMSNPALYYTIDSTGKVTYKDDYYKLSPQEKDYIDYDASKKNQNKIMNLRQFLNGVIDTLKVGGLSSATYYMTDVRGCRA